MQFEELLKIVTGLGNPRHVRAYLDYAYCSRIVKDMADGEGREEGKDATCIAVVGADGRLSPTSIDQDPDTFMTSIAACSPHQMSGFDSEGKDMLAKHMDENFEKLENGDYKNNGVTFRFVPVPQMMDSIAADATAAMGRITEYATRQGLPELRDLSVDEWKQLVELMDRLEANALQTLLSRAMQQMGVPAADASGMSPVAVVPVAGDVDLAAEAEKLKEVVANAIGVDPSNIDATIVDLDKSGDKPTLH